MIQEFKDYLIGNRGYSENTAAAYSKDLATFAYYVRNARPGKRWSTIEKQDVDAYALWLSQTDHKPATICRHISSIAALYNWLKSNGRVESNPARYAVRPKVAQEIPNTIPYDVLFRVWKHTTGELHGIVSILTFTGCRVQEALNVTTQDIHWERRALTLHGKGGKSREVAICDWLMTALQDAAHDHPFRLFPKWTQRQVRWELYNIMAQDTNVKQKSPHAIRHTYATIQAQRGANVAQLANILGHQSIKTTQKYIDMAAVDTRQLALNFEIPTNN